MAKKRKDKESAAPAALASGSARLVALMVEGDNRSARALAGQLLADPSTGEEERQAAEALLRRTGFDPPALATGLAASAVVSSLVVVLFLV